MKSKKSSVHCLLFSILVSCTGESVDTPREEPVVSAPLNQETMTLSPELSAKAQEDVRQISLSYLDSIDSDFQEASKELATFSQEIANLLSSPSSVNLSRAQEYWSQAHTAFEQTTLHRYFIYNISSEAQSLSLFQLQYRMNQWPIIAGYIDSVNGYEQGGIVHDVNVEISQESFSEQHGLFDVNEVTLGFHVIEFLLWGETNTSSARSAEDFLSISQLTDVQKESGMLVSQLGNNRRRDILDLTVSLLIDDFQQNEAIWQSSRSEFLNTLSDVSSASLLNLLLESTTAMLTEELLVRSLYPLLNGENENALQSPYSQTSEKAVAAQLRSIEGVLVENSTDDGITLDKILSELSPSFEELFYQNLDSTKACLILLYSNVGSEEYDLMSSDAEFEVVECINLLTNLLDQLEQIKLTLPNFRTIV